MSQRRAVPDKPQGDPFLFDADRLQALASEAVVRRGVAYFKEHRVLSLGWDDGSLWAEVEGSVPGSPYTVQVALDQDHELMPQCTCPFDLEPACKHVVAALLAYAAQVDAALVESASEQAVLERQRRARTEVVVEHALGNPTFGTWHARTISDAGAKLRPHRVHIRSTKERINACSCPDFAGNRLGTCKHIEAVLHQLAKRRLRAAEPALPVVYLDLGGGPEAEPAIRLRRTTRDVEDDGAGERDRLLDRHFDAHGALIGSLPAAWDALVRDVAERDDLHLGEDAVAHAQRVAADLAHAARREAIRDAIGRSGGHLPGVHARLYPYQTEGVAFLASTGRALLADDMGLGKTLQAIAAARWLFDHEGVARVLVVCPASLKSQWAREVRRFTGLDALVIEGGAEPRLAQYRRHAPFTIVNYELVVRDLQAITTTLCPDLLVLDEAQRIKNWRTKTAATIKALPTRYAFVLSGTPLENRLEDLYSLMQVVDARVLGPLWHYLLQFQVSDERGQVVAYRNLSELRRRLAPVMLRRDKRLVREQLPDRVVQVVPVPLSERQRELHAGALMAASNIARVRARRPLTPSEEKQLMAALQAARMACDAAGLLDGETVGSPKLDELGRILEAACVEGGDKVVVFSQWERMTAMAEAVARGLGLGVARLHGGVPTHQRGALVDRFREDPEVQVFISTDAGSTGLNLQNASIFVNLDLPWNPAILEQRIGRVHRLGQTQPVHAYLLVSEASYEEHVGRLVRGKAELFGSVIEPEAEADVVALTKRTLEVALEAATETLAELGAATPEAAPEVVAGEPPPPTEPAPAEPDRVPVKTSDDDDLAPALRELIAAASVALAGHVEEMIVTARGLVVIVDAADASTSAAAAALSGELEVVALDRRTWQALGKLRPEGVVPVRSVRAMPAPEAATTPPLLALARRQLAAADSLVERGMAGAALALFAESLVAAAALAAGRSTAPALADAPLWLFAEAVPKGMAPIEVAHAVASAVSLSHLPEVPATIVADVGARAHAFVA